MKVGAVVCRGLGERSATLFPYFIAKPDLSSNTSSNKMRSMQLGDHNMAGARSLRSQLDVALDTLDNALTGLIGTVEYGRA